MFDYSTRFSPFGIQQPLSRREQLKYLFLELTSKCNMACEHCGSNCSAKASNTELTTKQWKDFILYASKHFDSNRVIFCITGGEPLLRPDFFDIVKTIKKAGFKWGLTTNGIMIKDSDYVRELYLSGMKTISLSIDGLKDTHDTFRGMIGAYDKTMAAIKLFYERSKHAHVQVTTTVSKKNIAELERLYLELKNNGVRDWRIASVDPIGRAETATDLLLDEDDYSKLFSFISELRKKNEINVTYGCAHYIPDSFRYNLRDMPYKCGAGEFVASVLCNGDIYSCIDIERRPELVQGNVLKDDFLQVWEKGFKPFKGAERIKKSPKCSNCGNAPICNGDSAHTWDYDKCEPKICLYELMRKRKYSELGRCGNCGDYLEDDAKFCESCGTKRGDGDFEHYDFSEDMFQTLYGPPPMNYRFECKECGSQWNRVLMSAGSVKYCPGCGSNKIQNTFEESFW